MVAEVTDKNFKDKISDGFSVIVFTSEWQERELDSKIIDGVKGYENAKRDLLSPLEFSEEDRSIGKELYGIYCALCHGNKGDGQGILMKREKFLGVPSYADRDITLGSIYHVLIYGRNAMGSHSGQLNIKERWQVSHYAMELRKELIK